MWGFAVLFKTTSATFEVAEGYSGKNTLLCIIKCGQSRQICNDNVQGLGHFYP